MAAEGVDVAHFFYFLREELPAFESLCTFLSRTYQAQDDLLGGSLEGPPTCNLVTPDGGRRAEVRLSMSPGVAGIQVRWLTSSKSKAAKRERWQEYRNEVAGLRKSLEEQSQSPVGEATVLVSRDAAGGLEDATQLFPDVEARGIPIPGGRLVHFLEKQHEGIHAYLLSAEGQAVDSYLENVFSLDAVLQRLERETKYYEEQRASAVREKREIDETIGTILHERMVRDAESSESESFLEHEVAKLSRMYGVLATNTLLIRQARETLNKDYELFESEVNSLNGGADGADHFQDHYGERFREALRRSDADTEDHLLSLKNAKTAIDVVRTQVELLRGKTGLAIQEQTRELLQERLALQAAASFVEFVVVFYYALVAWKTLTPHEVFDSIPGFYKFGTVLLFAGSAVLVTHAIAYGYRQESWRSWRLAAALAALVASLALMIWVTFVSSVSL